MTGDDTIHWLRPANTFESIICHIGEGAGVILSTYGLTLRTTQPLKDKQVQEALVHLFRKVPTLRLCFRRREDVFWACDMGREHIDFKVVDTSDQIKVQEELMKYQFNESEGPLWCARLLQQDSCGGSTSPGLAASFPYSRSLVLVNHHAIADGTTNNRTVNVFLQILDDIIAGKPIDDNEQFGELASGEETIALIEAREQELKKNEDLLNQTLQEFKERQSLEKLIPRAFPYPDDPNYTTKMVTETLDEETTTLFFQRCKQEGVTVHSGFVALVNGSLVDLVREAGLKQDTYPIYELHAINIRRYWHGDVSKALGCHISGMEHYGVLTHQWRDNFWQHVRDLHHNLHESLTNLKPIDFMVKLFLGKEGDMLQNMMKGRSEPMAEHDFANIGNLDHLIPTEGEHVRLAHVVRSNWCCEDRIVHMYHSLRGRFLYSLSYTSDHLSEKQARRFVELIFRNLKAMI